MDYTDFLKKPESVEPTQVESAPSEAEAVETEEIVAEENIDVQKAVVEELAAEKVAMELKLDELNKKIAELEAEKAALIEANKKLEDEKLVIKNAANNSVKIEAENAKLKEENAKLSDALVANTESTTSNQIALLDRNLELPDRFLGETREHVINAIKVALEEARANGRIRRAQILEGVLVVNESTDEIEKRRAALEKFFADHQNIIDGEVLAKLQESGIPHKNGETYLLPSEILTRTY